MIITLLKSLRLGVPEVPLEPACLPAPRKSQRLGGSSSHVGSRFPATWRHNCGATLPPPRRRCWARFPEAAALPGSARHAPGPWPPRLGAEDRTPPPTLQQPDAARHPGSLPTPEQIFENIKQEYSHYQKWSHSEVVLNQSKAYVSESRPPSAAHPAPSSPGSSWMKNDQSPFTLQQVRIICEHLLKDQKDHIWEGYEQILCT